MGFVNGFKASGLFAKMALALLIVSCVFAWIAYTCTGWGEERDSGVHYGLWRICSNDKYVSGCFPTDGWANGKTTSKS